MSSQVTAVTAQGNSNSREGLGGDSGSERQHLFPATQWSVISQARGGDGAVVEDGLRKLAVGYWRPLYLFLRKRGESHEDASDSVQGFFEFVFSGKFLDYVERDGGKFRSYLLKSLERWRGRRRVKEGAQKRGGGVVHLPLDEVDEMQREADLSDDLSAEATFDRQWAMEMVGRAVTGLREEYLGRDRLGWFEALRGVLPGGGEPVAYAELAVRLGATEGAVKKAAFDLRSAFAGRLREEIRSTVQTNEDAEEELRYLISAMGSGER